ncbi:hypothetical protein FACS189427_01990 [Planctomycetales bacterium]|nr:hypothetical protein FACS189427_01990 [Planctomycetales bacterium]
MNNIVISVIIPVYNAEKYLRQCLDSACNQTLRDIQIICVNDGSTDGSLKILQEYAAKDDRILVINQPNGGISAARNAGLHRIKGQWTLFLDSDDTLETNACGKLAAKISQTDANVIFFFDHRCRRLANWNNFEDKITPRERLPVILSAVVWNKCWNSEFLKNNDLLFEDGWGEDDLFTWKGCVLANKIAVLPAELYWYRTVAGSNTHNKSSRHTERIEQYDRVKRFLEKYGLLADYQSFLAEMKMEAARKYYWYIPADVQDAYLRQIRESLTDCDRKYVEDCYPSFYKLILDGSTLGKLQYKLWYRPLELLAEHFRNYVLGAVKKLSVRVLRKFFCI